MNELVHHSLTVFLGFFAIMNPISNTTVFSALTGHMDRQEQQRIARKSIFISFLIIVLFSASGKLIFHVFGISLPALRIAGGILVFVIGYQMLHGSGSRMHEPGEQKHEDPSISPLAVPILAGPGAIATAMNFSASGDWHEIIITVLAFSLLAVITYACFIASERLLKVLGPRVFDIMTRLMGLILAVIGIQMMIHGITTVAEIIG